MADIIFVPKSSKTITVKDSQQNEVTSKYFNSSKNEVKVKETDFFVPKINGEDARFVDCKDKNIERVSKSIVNIGVSYSFLVHEMDMESSDAMQAATNTETTRTAKWNK